MSSSLPSSNRPVFIPRGKRQNRKTASRFHGAFTGGFSAGYFNTVGSKEGWRPSSDDHGKDDDGEETGQIRSRTSTSYHLSESDSKLQSQDSINKGNTRKRQRVEDFMDEMDHDEWGGPSRVQIEYQSSKASNQNSAERNQSIDAAGETSILNSETAALLGIHNNEPLVASKSLGYELLRLWGWRNRPGSTRDLSLAYVPTGEVEPDQQNDALPFLSQKRLRRIQLQQTRVKIPIAKLDMAGLGYEPFADAPEFRKAYEERRRKSQQMKRKVYRVNDVVDGKSELPVGHQKDSNEFAGTSSNNPSLYQQAMEDFVGNKSVGGFALREDEDDAYDDRQDTGERKLGMDGKATGRDRVSYDLEAYNSEVYEHEDSDAEDPASDRGSGIEGKSGTLDFAGALLSWTDSSTGAAIGQRISAKFPAGVTSNGQPPLRGFRLGSSWDESFLSQRFRGPDLPPNYEVEPHVFGPHEHPLVLKTLSRAMQLKVSDARKNAAIEEALKSNAVQTRAGQNRSEAKRDIFAGLSSSISKRFAAAASDDAAAKESSIQEKQPIEETRPITVTRSVQSFAPTSLLCKRFNVLPPQNVVASNNNSDAPKTREEEFFDEIMANVKKAGKVAGTVKPMEGDQGVAAKDGNTNDGTERPPMAVYKSIFDPLSDSTSDVESDQGKEDQATTRETDPATSKEDPVAVTMQQSVRRGMFSDGQPSCNDSAQHESRLVPYRGQGRSNEFGDRRQELERVDVQNDSPGSDWSKEDDSSSEDSRRRSRRKEERKRHKRKKKHIKKKKKKRSKH